jgi:hypothetical protein
MEPEGSLPCSQEPSTGPYPEPNQSNPYCVVLPVNTSNNFVGCGFCVSIYWILHQAEFTITYNTSNYIT